MSRMLRSLELGDAEGLLAVQESRVDHDQIDLLSTFEGVPTLDQVTGWIAHKAEEQSLDTVLVAEVHGLLVGYTWLEWWTETDGVRLFLSQAALHPAWRGQGFGTAMLRWAEERLRAEAARQTETGPAFFGANATETEHDDTALLLGAGYQRAFAVLEMARDTLESIPEAMLPEGILVCPLQLEQFLAVGRSVTECYRESLFAAEPSADENQRQIAWLRGFDPALCFVAWDGGEVAGQVICRSERGRGEFAEVSVRKPWRRRGLAKALLAHGLRAFRDSGLNRARLHTVAENKYGSVQLYESIGFHVLKAHVRYRKPMA